MMTIDEARALLEPLRRDTRTDRAFGDTEVTWVNVLGKPVAEGTFGRNLPQDSVFFRSLGAVFYGEEARELLRCGQPEAERSQYRDRY